MNPPNRQPDQPKQTYRVQVIDDDTGVSEGYPIDAASEDDARKEAMDQYRKRHGDMKADNAHAVILKGRG